MYLYERNTRNFDLTKALKVYQFATVLTRLRTQAKQMLQQYLSTGLESPFLERVKSNAPRITQWIEPPKERGKTKPLPPGIGEDLAEELARMGIADSGSK